MDSNNTSRKNSLKAQTRTRLSSLKKIKAGISNSLNMKTQDLAVLNKLEKDLQKHNKEQQNLTDPSSMIPHQEAKNLDRIWAEFKAEEPTIASKIERQKVNFYQKFVGEAKRQFHGFQDARKNCIQGLQASIKQKYLKINTYFEEIKKEKAVVNFINNSMKINKKNKMTESAVKDNSHKVEALKRNVEDLKKEITGIQKEKQTLQEQYNKLNEQWIYFLKRFLKQGYYLRKGAIPILRQLFQLKVKVKIDDMPKCLDDTSKRCLLQQYQSFKQIISPQINKRSINDSPPKMSSLAKKQMTRDIYLNTKLHIMNLIKQPSWKQSRTTPILKQTKKVKDVNWQEGQKKRLAHMYSNEEYQRAKSILFGLRGQTVG